MKGKFLQYQSKYQQLSVLQVNKLFLTIYGSGTMRLTIMEAGITHKLIIAARAIFPISSSIFNNNRTTMATIIQDVKRRISMSCATATTQHAQAEFSP